VGRLKPDIDAAKMGVASNIPHPKIALWALPIFLLVFGAVIYEAIQFPVVPFLLAAALAGYAVLLWRMPSAWLLAVPALLPILNFAPWSGRFFFDELDLFLLTTVAVWLVRGRLGQSAKLVPAAGYIIIVLIVVSTVSLLLGLLPLEPMDGNAFANYYSKYNGLRMTKSLAWAVVLLFLLRAELGRDSEVLKTHFAPGMLVGLAGVVLVALWERVAFPGLTNFSEEYRITSTFGSMHVGGGAIDGYLVLALPFTLVWFSETKSTLRLAVASVLLALGSYAVLATYSRGLYAACMVMVIALAFGGMLRQRAMGSFHIGRSMAAAVVILLLSGLCFSVFAGGGYRALAAVLGVLGLGFFVGRKAELRSGTAVALTAAIGLIGASVALVLLMDKGAYVGYAVSFLAGAAGVIFTLLRPHTSKQRLNFAGFLATAVIAPMVANHWGGSSAMWVAMAFVLFVLVLVFINRSVKRPLWSPNIRHAAVFSFVSLIFFLSIPIAGNSYFVGERFSGKSNNLNDRVNHWQNALNIMDQTVIAQLFGMGVGRFPAVYFSRSARTAPPGTFTIMNDFGNGYLRLRGAQDRLGGVVLYYSQFVRPEPYQALLLSFDARSTFAGAGIQFGICESMLLYSENCDIKTARLAKADGSWQPVQMPVTTRNLGSWHKYGKRPVKVSLVNPVGATDIDIDNVRLTDSAGSDLLKNGDFTNGGDNWLFTISDFAPYHIDSVWVHAVFEQGWLGLILLVALILYALARLLLLIRQGNLIALALFVAFSGFVVVGTFNSLFEFPRVALLFYLLLFIALTRWETQNKSGRPGRLRGEPSDQGMS
jgi:hypothetical protein